jgi:hypothetical protein
VILPPSRSKCAQSGEAPHFVGEVVFRWLTSPDDQRGLFSARPVPPGDAFLRDGGVHPLDERVEPFPDGGFE